MRDALGWARQTRPATLQRIATMRLRFLTTFAVAALATLTASACSNESPSAPPNAAAPAAASQSLLGLGGTTSTKTVIPLLRTTPLPADVTVSQTIGALGGTISIPSAGLTLVVPPLAVGKATNFVITARKGSYVA